MESPLVKLANRALLISLPVAILGATFKLLHLTGANYLLLLGLGTVAIAVLVKYLTENTIDGYLTGIAISAGCIAFLFKILHFHHSQLVVNIAIVAAIMWGAKTLLFPDKEKNREE